MSWLSAFKRMFSENEQSNSLEQKIAIRISTYFKDHRPTLHDRVSGYELQDQKRVQIMLTLNESEQHLAQSIHDELAEQLQSFGIEEVNMIIRLQKDQSPADQVKTHQPNASSDQETITKKAPLQQQVPAHPRIKDVIVVSSGKGGVGKSTTTVNLALALQKLGKKVGVLDADIYGPSIPTMLGNAGKTPLIEHEHFVPLNAYDMPVISIGHLTGDETTPIVWRGAKATGALMQLFNQTLWPELDILLIDMPPGTGDIQLTLAQRIPVSGAVIVTTPQHIALLDAQKGIELFNKVHIPVLGVVENMSYHICQHCGQTEHIFGTEGGEQLASHYHVPILGHLPLNRHIRQNADLGRPSVVVEDEASPYYLQIAEKTLQQLAQLPPRKREDKRFF